MKTSCLPIRSSLILVIVCSVAAAQTNPAIPKTGVAATLIQGSQAGGHTPAYTIDGSIPQYWEGAGGFPYCIRYDFGAGGRKRFVQFDFHPYHGYTFNNWEVYITDSTWTNPADWGTPVKAGTVPVAPPGLSLPDEVTHLHLEPPVNGRFLMMRMLNGNVRSLLREVWFYGTNAGPFFLSTPVSVSMFTETSKTIGFSVGDDEGTEILADLAIADAAGALTAATVAGGDVLAGGDDVFTFNAGSGWEAAEGALTLTASAATGTVTVTVTESDSGGYTPQEVLSRVVTVEVQPRVLNLSLPALVILSTNQTTDIAISCPAPAPGSIGVTPGTPSGSSATIAAVGSLGIADGATNAPGVVRITASAATAGVTTMDLTAGNGFVWEETGTATVTIRASVLTNGVIHVAVDGNDTTGDGSVALPLRTLTMAATFVKFVPRVAMGPGSYTAAAGEDYPLAIPAGLTVVGTMGAASNETDSTVLNAGGTAQALALGITPSGTTGLLKNLVISNFLGGAINATQWRGRIDTCLITGAVPGPASAAVLYHLSGNTDLLVTNTVIRNIVNTQTAMIVNFASGAGPVVFAGCTFKDITVRQTSLQNHVGVVYFFGFTVTMHGSVFDNLVCSSTSGAYAGSFFHPRNGTLLFDRSIIRNMSETGNILGGNSSGTSTIRNSLFYNVNANGWGVVGGYATIWNVYNSTFDNCSVVFDSYNGGQYGYFRNCSISDCGTINDYAGTPYMELHSVNVYNTPLQNYQVLASTAVTTNAPLYVNRPAGDFRPRVVSPLVDAGNNAHVLAGNTIDLAGTTRLLDGNADGTNTVDLGCYEVNTVSPSRPTFVAPRPIYSLVAGSSLAVPIDILPDAAGSPVVAGIAYGTDLSGPATLTFPDGAGPSQLVVTAAASLSNPPGTMSVVTLTEQTSQGVQMGEFGLLLFELDATVSLSGRTFVRAGETNAIRVSLVGGAAAPSQIAITPGLRTGSGSNPMAWEGNAYIAAGASQSDGYLKVVGGSGINRFALTIGGGLTFVETGTDTITIEVTGYDSPLYVDDTGNDATGEGTLASPLKTFELAVSLLEVGETIRVLPGTYSAGTGQTFPIRPGGVRVVGYNPGGPLVPSEHTIDGEGTANNLLFYLDTAVGAGGYLEGLKFTRSAQAAVVADDAALTVTNCLFANIFCNDDNAAAILCFDDAANVSAWDCVFSNCVGRGAVGLQQAGSAKSPEFTAYGCDFLSNTSRTGTIYCYYDGEPYGIVTLTDCLFDRNTASSAGVAWTHGASAVWMACNGPGRLWIDRCTFRNGVGGRLFSMVRLTGRMANSLFVNNQASVGDMFMGYEYNVPLVNCTFTGNSGGYAQWYPTPSARLYNCIVAGDAVLTTAESNLILQNTILWETPLGNGYSVGSSVNVIAADPRFLDKAAGNYRPRHWGPAIDAGSNALVYGTLDLVGDPRQVDGNKDAVATVDIGAYERSAAPPEGAMFLIR